MFRAIALEPLCRERNSVCLALLIGLSWPAAGFYEGTYTRFWSQIRIAMLRGHFGAFGR
jgi:hypothetical protein